ncbi:MAG: hypothetical protein WC602_04085 [archaeon]
MLALFLEHLLSFDLGWILGLLLNNWLWAFIFLAVSYFLFGQKKFIAGFFVLTILLWSFLDFNKITGLGLLDPQFIMLTILAMIIVGLFVENTPGLSRHFVFISSARWVFVVIMYNVFLR